MGGGLLLFVVSLTCILKAQAYHRQWVPASKLRASLKLSSEST